VLELRPASRIRLLQTCPWSKNESYYNRQRNDRKQIAVKIVTRGSAEAAISCLFYLVNYHIRESGNDARQFSELVITKCIQWRVNHVLGTSSPCLPPPIYHFPTYRVGPHIDNYVRPKAALHPSVQPEPIRPPASILGRLTAPLRYISYKSTI
jgi:hypothetical protein